MAQTYCYLPNATELSPQVIASVSNGFAQLRSAGVKALWRFAYDHSMPGENYYTTDTVLGHIRQLETTMAKNTDALYALQAGFLGSWGEWHSSQTNLESNASSTSAIVEAELFSLLPADRKINVRVPVYKLSGVLRRGGATADRMAYGVLATTEQAKLNTAVARVGYDNDGFMSTMGDGGTFGSLYHSSEWERGEAKVAPFPAQNGAIRESRATPLYQVLVCDFGLATRQSMGHLWILSTAMQVGSRLGSQSTARCFGTKDINSTTPLGPW